ncbi:MAG: sulfatase [Planctomycetaceae bacterium]
MRMMTLLGLLLAVLGCRKQANKPDELTSPETATQRRPNVIVIYSDDHGFADLRCQQVDENIKTPHLDEMAAAGLRCTYGYVSAPQCVPSRAGLLTGRYQQRFGVEDNFDGPLPLAERTIAELLQPAGYVSGQVGKWHLEQLSVRPHGEGGVAAHEPDGSTNVPMGRHDPFLPAGQGFDEYFCGAMNTYIASHDLQGAKLRDAPDLVMDRRFRIDVQTEAATSFIRRHREESFFLYVAYFAPHVPLESPEPWFSQTDRELPLQRRQALAMMAAMDDGVGRIRRLLRDLDIAQDTLLFFISDNGAPLMPGAWDGSLNTPLVGEKGMLTDGGTRTPFLVEWPGRLPANVVYEHPVFNLDVAATALAVAGLPPDDTLDGVNLLPYLNNERPDPPHTALFWRWRSQAAVLQDGWKLIRVGDREQYLFDLASPESERRNRLRDDPQRAAELRSKLDAWSLQLAPPGLPSKVTRQDEVFYRTHLLSDDIPDRDADDD